jgi:hypothetical protein
MPQVVGRSKNAEASDLLTEGRAEMVKISCNLGRAILENPCKKQPRRYVGNAYGLREALSLLATYNARLV